MRQIMRSSLDYAGFAQLCARSPIMRKIMRAHNCIIQRSLVLSWNCRLLLSPFRNHASHPPRVSALKQQGRNIRWLRWRSPLLSHFEYMSYGTDGRTYRHQTDAIRFPPWSRPAWQTYRIHRQGVVRVNYIEMSTYSLLQYTTWEAILTCAQKLT